MPDCRLLLRFSALSRIIVDLGLSPELDASSLMTRFVEHSTRLDFHQWVIHDGHLTAVDLAQVEKKFALEPFLCGRCGAVRTGCELRGLVRLRCPVCSSTELRFQEESPEFDRLAREISGDEWEVGSLARAPKFGDWIGVEEVGKGSCGTVYRAINPGTGDVAAVKTLDVEHERIVQGFFHEARLCTTIRHPNIVRVTDFGEVDGEPYIVMDWIDGTPLDDMVEYSGALDLDEAIAIGAQMARALEAVHAAGVVHRDIKPGNIMVTGPGTACLMDFGIAKDFDWTVTPHEIVMGTLQFMAPEQFVDTSEVTTATDVFSLGVTLYHAMTGEDAENGLGEPGMPPRQVPPPSLRAVLPDAPPELDELITAMCTFRPADRPSVKEVAERLEGVIAARGNQGE